LVGAGVLADQLEVVGELTFRDVSLTREDLYRLAVMNRPDLRAAQAAFEKAQADVNLARANAWWDVTPLLEYQRIQNDNTFGFGISLPIRVFDRNQGEIARTKAEVQRSSAMSRAVGIQALAEVDTARSVATTEREKVRRLREIYLPKAAQARDTVEFAYRRGGLSLLDFLDAQRTYRETALEKLRALGNYSSAVYQLESALGRPPGKKHADHRPHNPPARHLRDRMHGPFLLVRARGCSGGRESGGARAAALDRRRDRVAPLPDARKRAGDERKDAVRRGTSGARARAGDGPCAGGAGPA